MKKLFFSLSLATALFVINTHAGDIKVNKIEPPNWWIGMHNSRLQLMVYGENLTDVKAEFDRKEIKIINVHHTGNPSYLFIDIGIPENLRPGNYKLTLKTESSSSQVDYPLLKRENPEGRFRGFDQKDIIYLVMPDRFSNGDTLNDSVEGFSEAVDRTNRDGRHGGDIQGIIDKLDYIKEMGMTAIWLNPVVENNTFRSYHGYSATDFYSVDPRLGTNDLYREMVQLAHEKGLKVILDHVSNHISIDHPWIKDLPMRDWIHGTPEEFKPASHHKMVSFDIYSDSTSVRNVDEGWFTHYMPDLNQDNPFLAEYIIQNTIWWIEFAGLDGVREDTYPYADQEFLARWAQAILSEYPELNIVGEVWTGETDFLAAYQRDSKLRKNFNSGLPVVTDFGMRDKYYGLIRGKNNLYDIFVTLSKDYLFADAANLLTFIDNHDVPRAMFASGGDFNKVKPALLLLLTTRGIPQIFYATEIGMVGTDHHGELRGEFPGGFPGDNRDAFSRAGRTAEENEVFEFLTKMIKLRANHPALSAGSLIHFPPEDELYIYFKFLDEEKIMIIINNSETEAVINSERYDHLVKPGSSMRDLWTDELFMFSLQNPFKIPPKSFYLLLAEE